MSDLYRKADEAGNAVQLNATPTDNIVQRLEALEAKCVPATDSNQGLVQPDNDTIVILNGKLVATGLHMAWNAQTDYKPGWIVRGPDGKDYVAKEPSGPETNVGPKDPTDITNNQYWEEWSGGGGAKPVIIPVPTILGNLAPIAGQQYTYTFEVAGIALDSVAKFEIALSLNSGGTVTTRTAEVNATNNVATWPFQVPATMRNGDTITMQVVAVDKLGNRSDPAIANLSVGVVNVDAPTITAPTSGTVHYYMTSDLTVKTTPFTIRGATDAHVSTDWVISTDNLGQNVVAQASNSSDLTSHTFTKAELAALRDGQTYYIRARHRSRTYGVSAWSAAVGVMARASSVNQPTIIAPASGEQVFPANGITVNTSAFATTGGTDTHKNTDYRISSGANGSGVVAQALASIDKTSHIFTANDLTGLVGGNDYYISARHRGVALGEGAWANDIRVTAQNEQVTATGRKIGRHQSNKGSVITYDEFGVTKRILVYDAVYRSRSGLKWGVENQNIPGLNYWNNRYFIGTDSINKNTSDSDYINCLTKKNLLPYKDKFTDSFFNKVLGESLYPVLQTAKHATDILMNYNDTDAAHYCRAQNNVIPGIEAQLPNIYQLLVIYALGDYIDSLDKTVAENKNNAIGLYGDNQYRLFNLNVCVAQSSTQASLQNNCQIGGPGYTGTYSKSNKYSIIPIAEL